VRKGEGHWAIRVIYNCWLIKINVMGFGFLGENAKKSGLGGAWCESGKDFNAQDQENGKSLFPGGGGGYA
jgi:hypothetical protein